MLCLKIPFRCPEIFVNIEIWRVAKLAKSSYSLLLLFFFFIKIDFYVSAAIKVVLAQIQIYIQGNKFRTVLFLDLDNEYFQPLTATYLLGRHL